ncbi:hypothetical protein [Arthrobacter globiformis]|uniref:hypothetical protein n=1 Tax=Arthrobacter globiformis TaxID=1665 RepID=UPI0027936340|nr:hypothetical protein [Arthrobacter globiformis]MDQ0617259.1 hypothetical protein [Arthrobacter globiformis]
MKKRIQLQHTGSSSNGRTPRPRTGDHCPANGWWAPLNDEATQHFITEGSIMPPANGTPMSWKLVIGQPLQVQRPSHDFPPRGFALDSI